MSFEEWARRAELAEAAGNAAWFRAVPEGLAAALGCTLVVADTTEDTPERPNPSHRNMPRLGFEHAYTKLIYHTPRA